MSSQSRSSTSSPCGCSGTSHATPSSGCGCGCSTAECREGAYVRPRFFAGQLLTEEDLQSLGGYVVAKNRLHNRHVFGEGVVCGLAVTCDPCGGSKVIVHPGHALDCCGNDVVLACKQTLDVNAMVRDLRQRLLGGYDCGDPCADRKGAAWTPGAAAAVGSTQDKGLPAPESRHYCLYVRYCEDLAEPVSRYATDEPCAAQGCEHTRVREGLRFELRCRDERRRPAQLADRHRECLGDAAQAERIAGDALVIDRIAWRKLQAMPKQPKDPSHPINPAVLTTLTDSATAAIQRAKEDPSPANVQRALDLSVSLAERLDQLSHLDDVRSEALRKESPNLGTKVQEGLETLTQVQQVAAHPSVTLMERQAVRTHLGRVETRLPSLQVWHVSDSGSEGRIAHKTLWSDESVSVLNGQFEDKVCKLREELLDWLDRSPDLADCALRREVRSIDVCREPGQPPAIEDPAYLAAARKLAIASLRRWQECLCRALNPPCPPCDDLGVLLACLEVRECEVVRICNLERTFVLTPAALRYWLPLHRYEQELERLCCGKLEPAEEPAHGTVQTEHDVAFFHLRALPSTEAARFQVAFQAINDLAAANQVRVSLPAFACGTALVGPATLAAATTRSASDVAPPPATPQKESATALEGAQRGLRGLQSELRKLAKRNAELEKRLKAVEEKKKS